MERSDVSSGSVDLPDFDPRNDDNNDTYEVIRDSAENIVDAPPSAISTASIEEDWVEEALDLSNCSNLDTACQEQVAHGTEVKMAEPEGPEPSEEAEGSPGYEDVGDGEGENIGKLEQEEEAMLFEARPRRDSIDLLTDLLEDDEEAEFFTLNAGTGADEEMFMDLTGKTSGQEQGMPGQALWGLLLEVKLLD